MREFTNLVTVELLTGATYEFLADRVDFDPAFQDEEGGPLWDCSQTFVVDEPDDLSLEAFAWPRLATVTLKDSKQQTYQIGTREVPARVSLQRHLQRARLTVDCQMVSDPLKH